MADQAALNALQNIVVAINKLQTTIASFGVPAGGTAGQALTKVSSTSYDTEWTTLLQQLVPGTAVNLGSSLSGTVNIDLSAGTFFYGTVTGNTTFTVTNPPASGKGIWFTLEITNGGASTLTWTAGTWAGGSPPAFTAAGTDIIAGFTRDAATTVNYAALSIDAG